jgi:hypothetical protein
MRRSSSAFTLAELLVSITVLTIIVLLTSTMVHSAADVIALDTKKQDVETQVRPVFDRIGLDLARMVRRPDVDYYVKGPLDSEVGNDHIAFFCSTPGYYPSTGSQRPLSLVSYRINSDSTSVSSNRMERMGKGLLWNSSDATAGMAFGLEKIATNWPAATSNSSPDSDYELIGPQIFRFEYSYILNTGIVSAFPGANGLKEVSAISVTIAAVDQKSQVLLSDVQLKAIIDSLPDFAPDMGLAGLATSWQSALNATAGLPRTAIHGVRIYQKTFPMTP